MKHLHVSRHIRQLHRLLILQFCLLFGSLASHATVAGWGTITSSNNYGQLVIPQNLFGAKSIAAGGWHALAVTAANKVVAWGLNDYGQTNVPAGLSNVLAVAGGFDHSLALKTNGTVIGWGITSNLFAFDPDWFGQADVPGDVTNVVAISAGAFHSLALKANGTVRAWGYDFYGQCDVPNGLSNIVAIACGGYFSLALRNDGTVVAWGDNYYGQTNIPASLTNVVAIVGGGVHGLALKADGSVQGWGARGVADFTQDFGQENAPADLTNAVSIAAGFFHSLAVQSNGIVRQWGDTSLGQTNPPSNLNSVSTLAGGYAHSYALLYDAPPVILTQPTNVVAAVTNKAVSFVVQASGSLPLRATWYRSGTTNTILGAVTFSNTTTSVSFSGGTVTGSSTNLPAPQFALNLLASYVVSSNAVNYFVVVTNLAGSVTSSVASLTVLTPPKINNQPVNVATNPGATVFFNVGVSGSQPLSYQWWFNGNPLATAGLTNRLQLDNVSTNDSGSYQLVLTNAVGSVTSSVAVLTVGGAPAIATQPVNTSVRVGSNATLSAAVSGSQPLIYQWYYFQTNTDISSLVDGTNASYVVANAQTNNAGSYFFVVNNDFGSVTSSVAVLTVVAPPVILTQPTNVVAAVTNKAVSFVVQASGSLPLRATWYRSGTTNTILGAVTFSNTTTSVSFSGGTVTGSSTNLPAPQFALNLLASYVVSSNAVNYFVVVTNLAGSVTSSVASLTVLTPPKINNQPVNVATNPGATVFFNVGVSGSQPLSYQWWFNGNPLATAGLTNRLQLDNVSTNDSGSYQLVLTNAVGSVTSSVARLTILVNGASSAPYLWLLNHDPSGGDGIMIALESGRNYRVQSSTDLTSWTDVTNFLSHSSLVVFTNSNFENLPSLYYRVVTP